MTLDHNIYKYGAKGRKTQITAQNKETNKPDIYIISKDNKQCVGEWLQGYRVKEDKR